MNTNTVKSISDKLDKLQKNNRITLFKGVKINRVVTKTKVVKFG